jgi:adenylate cyclase
VRGVLKLQLLANGLGFSLVLVFVRLLFSTREIGERGELNLLVLGAFIAVMVILGLVVNGLLLRRAMVWVRDETPPTGRQRWLLFRLPFLESLAAMVTWAVGVVLFTLINASAARASVGIALAGILTCSALYMLLEGHFRPVFALALAETDLPEGRRDVFPRLLIAWLIGSALPLIAIGIGPLIDRERFDVARLPWLALSAVFGGAIVMSIAAISVARPLNRVREALRLVEGGDLSIRIPVDDLGELGRLAEGVNDLVAGLRERELLREAFGKQVGHAELAELSASPDAAGSGERREVTVMFVDLSGFTRYSEGHSPEEVVAMLNRFFRVVVAVVNREGGWINKFEGDAAMCVFGAPQLDENHGAGALRAAQALPRELARVPNVLPAGIGVASGVVIAGFLGTSERFEYTVIGDCVNLAARLCERSREHRSGVLAAAETVGSAGFPDTWVRVGRVRVRGRQQRGDVYTISPPRRGRD